MLCCKENIVQGTTKDVQRFAANPLCKEIAAISLLSVSWALQSFNI